MTPVGHTMMSEQAGPKRWGQERHPLPQILLGLAIKGQFELGPLC